MGVVFRTPHASGGHSSYNANGSGLVSGVLMAVADSVTHPVSPCRHERLNSAVRCKVGMSRMPGVNKQVETPAGEGRRSLGQRIFLLVGSIGPLGWAPASGTVAVAVAGVPLTWLMSTYLSPVAYAIVTAAFIVAAVFMHSHGDRILGESDSRRLVWDELGGYFVAMFLVPWSWKLAAVAFFVERALDILKVPPANVIDRRMHSGLGVVLDDVVAGAYTCMLMHLLLWYGPAWVR